MIQSADDIAKGTTLNADLLIIGGGAAGITIAREFAGSAHRVVLLESGGFDYDEATQALYQGTAEGAPSHELDTGRLRYFGGTTNHWAGWCRPLDPWDFEPHEGWAESGWPITRADLDPWYKKAIPVCQLLPLAFDDLAGWRELVGDAAMGPLLPDGDRLKTALFQISPPTRFGEVYRDDLQAAQNVQVILDANALELLPAEDSGDRRKRIRGAAVATLAGNRFSVTARAVIVATGGIETARLLLLSEKIHPTGAGNENDLVGRYYLDHGWIESGAYLRLSQEGLSLPLYFDEIDARGGRIFAILRPDPAVLRRDGIGNFRLWFRPSTVSTAGGDALRDIISNVKQGQLPDNLSDDLGNILSDIDILADSAYKTLFHTKKGIFTDSASNGKIKGADIDINFEQRPNPDSRVSLGEDRDALGQRRVVLDWNLTDADKHTALRAYELAALEFGRMALGRTRIRLSPEPADSWRDSVICSHHHSGTARMASDPRHGVVDAQCRVHSVENLFIAGSAVFPTTGFANPTLTIVALALRLAAHLKGELQ